VSGAIYTFAFNGTDAAGNVALPVTSTGVTFDNTLPVFSSVAPLPNAYINSITTSSDVSYTLSKAIASGSITMTRTGGTADAGSPHTCTLIGTARSIGAHNNLDLSNTTNACTVAQSLVSGAIYTFAFNGTDAIGNVAITVTSTGVTFDSTPSSVSWVAPVGDGGNFEVQDQMIQLEVTANKVLSKVVFQRLDYNTHIWITVPNGTVTSSPYRVAFDTSALLPGWNQVNAKGYDMAGNTTNNSIWLVHTRLYFLPLVFRH
jgi:hypothetical protein